MTTGSYIQLSALPEIRCRRLLMKRVIRRVEIKCPKCGCVQALKSTTS
jgi:phage FluMu protein Com